MLLHLVHIQAYLIFLDFQVLDLLLLHHKLVLKVSATLTTSSALFPQTRSTPYPITLVPGRYQVVSFRVVNFLFHLEELFYLCFIGPYKGYEIARNL